MVWLKPSEDVEDGEAGLLASRPGILVYSEGITSLVPKCHNKQ